MTFLIAIVIGVTFLVRFLVIKKNLVNCYAKILHLKYYKKIKKKTQFYLCKIYSIIFFNNLSSTHQILQV